MNFSFRMLQCTDCDAYKKLRLEGFQESPHSFSESFEDEAHLPLDFFRACMGEDSEHLTYGCFSAENELVGIATFKRDKRSKARHKSYIHTMYVRHDFRGKKIAIKLLNHLIDHARSLPGLEQIHLWVLNQESAARRLYLKVNFVSQGTIVKKDLKIGKEYVDAEYMTLAL